MDIEAIRAFCLSKQSATEAIKWDDDLVFSVAGKMFAIFSTTPPYTGCFKVADEVFDELSTTMHFKPAPYLARAKWVQVESLQVISASEWKRYLTQSYDLVVKRLTKKQKQI